MKFWRKIHLWLSVPFGLIIAAICFSGAMLIFEPEITRSFQKEVYYVKSSEGEPRPMNELMETVKATLPDSVSITGVTVFADKDRTYQVGLSKPRRASVFIDQYSGEITGKYERLGFFGAMFKLHRWLLVSGDPHAGNWGKTLVGISTIIFVIALISGVVIWWPRAMKGLVHSLSISLKKGWSGFWKGLHVAGGMWVLIFVLAMALTGLTYSFNWYRTAFYAVCGVEHTPRNFGQNIVSKEAKGESSEERVFRGGGRPEGRGHRGEGLPEGRGEGSRTNRETSDNGNGEFRNQEPEGVRGHRNIDGRRGGRRSEFGRWQQVYDELKEQNPDASQIMVGPETATVSLGTAGNGRASDRYQFDRRSGEISSSTKYTDAVPADKLRGWIYSIHTGSLGGIITRIIWFIAAILGASLPLTGYYIWIKRSIMKRKGQMVTHRHAD